jgi:lipid II:glycine glycyltransferase (peptidoglycan interpeptide bridge formation enzyme)
VHRLRNTKGVALGDVSTGRFAAALEVLIAAQRGRLYLASLDGEFIAGCFFGSVGDSAYYLFNGSTETALRTGATPSVLFHAVTDLSSEGFARINLGGVPASARERTSPDHGLYVFKRGLGAEPMLCQGGRLRLRVGRAVLFDVARRFRDQVVR